MDHERKINIKILILCVKFACLVGVIIPAGVGGKACPKKKELSMDKEGYEDMIQGRAAITAQLKSATGPFAHNSVP